MISEQFLHECFRIRWTSKEFLNSAQNKSNQLYHYRVESLLRYLEGIQLLPATTRLQDTLPVTVSTFRIERIALEDCGIHVHRKYLRVNVPVPLL
jgi:hypothetical protein